MEHDGSAIMTIVMAVGAGLSGAVTVLFKIVMRQTTEQINISKKVGELQGKQEGVNQLSEQVLKTVHEAVSLNNQENHKPKG